MIKSALQDVFIGANASDIGFMTRFITLAMSEDYNPEATSIAMETLREYFLQEIKNESPEFGASAEFTDLLIDLYIQRKSNFNMIK